MCVDEIPTFQVLERDPIRRAIPGSIEQQEFDYTRHGTVNMLVFLVVHSGLMELAFLANNDAEHYLPELELFHRQHKELRGVFLIQDGGRATSRATHESISLGVRAGGDPGIRPPMLRG